MNLIEVAHPSGALSEEDRALLAREITDVLVGDRVPGHDEAPESTMRRARAATHVGFRQLAGWHTGSGPWDRVGTPPLWLTMTVPEAWREETARTLIGLLRHAVRRLDAEHGWHRSGGDLWINVIGIEDGSIGLDGRAATGDDVVDFLTEEFRRSPTTTAADLPDGVVVDPMCGMRVRLGPRAITLERDGETLGFCAAACRAAYVRKEGLPGSLVDR